MSNNGNGDNTRAFSPFEWLVALRYLRPRRKEGFISVIAGFSFIGIMLGVMTLIVVMAVMNGFRQELFNKMLGLNGHVVVHSLDPNFGNYDTIANNVRAVSGVKYALPLIEGQVMVSTPSSSTGARWTTSRAIPASGSGTPSSGWPATASSRAIVTMASGPAWTPSRKRISWRSCGTLARRRGRSGDPGPTPDIPPGLHAYILRRIGRGTLAR